MGKVGVFYDMIPNDLMGAWRKHHGAEHHDSITGVFLFKS